MRDNDLKPSDRDIVCGVLEGNVNAFETLLLRHKDRVMTIVKRHVPSHDVEETAQDAFVRAYLSLASFKGTSEFAHWLSSIAVRTCYDYWRKVYRSREMPMSSLTEKHQEWLDAVLADQTDEALLEKGARKEAAELLDWALGTLSAEDRMVLALVYLEGLSGKEAAALLGWSVANVKVRSYRSRKKLEKILSGVMNA
jgi:RNA polymerase sigma-70 factor (ECF subfamily)